jgi:methyl-accepting chemotaxis protein
MAVQRWTDEMLDELASSVGEMRESITEMRESITEMRESITDIKDSVDGLRVTAQALLQVAAQNQRRMDMFEEEMELMKQRHAEDIELLKQRQAETDQRFNVLLEEVCYLIRGNQED